MTVTVGDKLPDITVHTMGEQGPVAVQTADALGHGKTVLIGVPGAFTPGCSKIHLPGYVEKAAELRAKGVDTVACVAVNDAWVMAAWGRDQGADDILMLGDGAGEFTRALGLEFDGSAIGLGLRSRRFAAVIDDGIITELEVEPKPGVDLSSCDNILAKL